MQRQVMVLAFGLGVGFGMPAMGQDAELVGYTTVPRNGAQGVLVYNQDCDSAFAGSRICTSGDLMLGNLPVRFADPTPKATN